MTVKTKNKTLSEGIAYEVNPAFTRQSYTMRNTVGQAETLTDPMLYPVNLNAGKMELAVSTGEAGVDGLLIATEDFDEVANNTDYAKKQLFLVRGPAIVRKSALPVNDIEGVAFVQADLITRLAAMDILVQSEPDQITTQVE